jgi:hypothetical protein
MSEQQGSLTGGWPGSADPEPADANVSPVEPAPTATAADAESPSADGFDRARVLRLLERLERDVATVETAMVHVEAGEHEAYAAAVASLEPAFD